MTEQMTNTAESNPAAHKSFWRILRARDGAIVVGIALATVLIHLWTGNKFGFHRDELATLEDARHLDWGYVAYPPVTPFFGRLSLELFGTSLNGFRFFAYIAQAVAVVLAGMMALHLGGKRWSAFVACSASVPFALAGGALMQYVSFDYLCWVLAAYFVVRLTSSGDPRWWLGIGGAIGLGMMAKYTMGIFALGIVAGVLTTEFRQHLKSKWLWMGVVLSLLIFLPNFIWQVQHEFISLDFLKHIHERDIRIGRTKDFLPDQVKLTLFALPLWLTGLYFTLFSPRGKRFRMLGWMYFVPLLLFVIAKGRGYYLGAAYPMLYAAGAVAMESWKERWQENSPSWRTYAFQTIVGLALFANIVIIATFTLPVGTINSEWWKVASKIQGDFREELGWEELTETVAKIRDTIPQNERAHLGILAGNYGEAGAINLYGPQYGLPRAISGINSFWQRGYGDPPPETLIVIGLSERFRKAKFSSCELAGHTGNKFGVPNEETEDHPDIYLCRGMKQSWQEFWKDFQYYG